MRGVGRPTAVSFHRLRDDDVRAMSVTQVTCDGDLRSDRMGGKIVCGTCGRSSALCNGHFGHIELPVPVEHPVFPGTTMQVLAVPPTKIRLPSQGFDAPLTSLLRRVLRTLARYRRVEAAKEDVGSARDAIAIAVKAYFTSGGGDSAAGLCQRLRGKQGILRQTLMGWRVNSCARAVIVPDPLLAPWEVGVPGPIAAVLNLKDGDSVVLNRQPSLHRGSMMAHIVRLRPHDFCLSISPTVTPPYNADFDGDEMNLHITNAASSADARCLLGVERNILSTSSGAPMVRLVQDACLSRYLKHGVDAHAQRLELLYLAETRTQAGAALALHDMQLESHEYMARRGFSVGVDDFLHRVPFTGADRDTLGTVAAMIKSHVPASNRIRQMVMAGSKGGVMNLVQLFACVGYQTVAGRGASGPLGEPTDSFVRSSFTEGLTEREFWMHACASREGMIQTAVKTADAGYLMRRMVKCFENVTVAYDGTVRAASGALVQFRYGGDGVDPVTSRFRQPRQMEPGEPVGITCAQAIGEKLTQLTLDTFHRAGVAFKHGLLRVKCLLDASAQDALLRGAPRPHALARYALGAVTGEWEPAGELPARAQLEMRMRGMAGPLPWRARPDADARGLEVWQVAARVREQVPCVCDGTFVYARDAPDGAVVGGAAWAGGALVDGCVSLQDGPPPLGPWHPSEPPMVAAQLGIEAACASMRAELAFYMPGVDARHLTLLADAMTQTGRVLGATRVGIRCTDPTSVLGRACFETAPQVLGRAAEAGATDPLRTASSRLAIGCLPRLGANAFDVVERTVAARVPRGAGSLLLEPACKRARFGQYM